MVRAKPKAAGSEGKPSVKKEKRGKHSKAQNAGVGKSTGVGKSSGVGKARIKIAKPRFWAVKAGRCPGVYTTQERFQQQVEGFSGAVSKRFGSREEAELFLQDGDEAKATHANKILASYAQTTNTSSSIKFDRSAFGRGFALGVTRPFFRTSAPKTVSQPLFGLLPSQPASSELPHHKKLRLSLGAAAEQAASTPAAAASSAADLDDDVAAAFSEDPNTNSAPAQPGAPQPAAAAQSSSEKEEEDGEAASSSSSDEARSSGDEGGAVSTSAADSGAMINLDEDVIELGPSRGASTALAAAADDATAAAEAGTTGLRYVAPRVEVKKSWENWEHPWYDANQNIRSQSLRLHNEIVELTTLLKSTAEEDKQRRDAVASVEAVVQAVFPGAQLKVFGSFSTGLHLPTSDVDCVILDAQVASVPMALTGLGKALQRMEWSSELEVIAKARVPLVKLRVMPVGLKFDISMGMDNGTKAVELVKSYLSAWSPMRPLVTILKLFLLQRNLNEVYSGGLGSYALLVSVVSFLQLHHSRALPLYNERDIGKLDCNLGVLLIDYFRFYGRALNYYDVGVTCAKGGFCYNKRATVKQDPRDRGDRLSLLDPLDDTNDVSRGTFNMRAIRSAFDHAYGTLTMPSVRSDALLSRILRLDDVLAIRPPPVKERPGSATGKHKNGKKGKDSGAKGKGERHAPRHEFSGRVPKRTKQ